MKDLITIQELADYLSVPTATVYRWNYLGSGPRYLKVGKHVRYWLADVEAWLASNEVGP